MGNIYNDNAIPYASRVLNFKRSSTAGTSGISSAWTTAITNLTAAVAENISVSRKLRDVSQYNEVGKPRGSFGVEDFATGSAVVQLVKEPGTFTADGVAITGTALSALQAGDGFGTTFDASIGAESFVITSVDQPEEALGYKKQSIQFKKLYSVTIAP